MSQRNVISECGDDDEDSGDDGGKGNEIEIFEIYDQFWLYAFFMLLQTSFIPHPFAPHSNEAEAVLAFTLLYSIGR